MKNNLTTLKYFTIADWIKEQDYLQDMHKKGWKFTGVSFLFFYHFVRCEPEDVVYQLDYNAKDTANDAEYIQMFEDCGWEYITDLVGYRYFRKSAAEMNGPEEIFCDEESRLDMLKRVAKGRLLPLLVIFFLVILPNIYIQNILKNTILASLYFGILVLYIIIFIHYAIQYLKINKLSRK